MLLCDCDAFRPGPSMLRATLLEVDGRRVLLLVLGFADVFVDLGKALLFFNP